MQALDGGHGVGLENRAAGQRLHAEHTDAFLDEERHDLFGEAPEVRVQHVQRHLHGVEPELVLGGNL